MCTPASCLSQINHKKLECHFWGMNKIIAYQPFIWGPLLLKGEITTHDTSYSRSVTNVFEHLKLGFSDDHDSSWGATGQSARPKNIGRVSKSPFFLYPFLQSEPDFFHKKIHAQGHNLSNKTVDCTHNVSLQLITNFLGVCFSHSCSAFVGSEACACGEEGGLNHPDSRRVLFNGTGSIR